MPTLTLLRWWSRTQPSDDAFGAWFIGAGIDFEFHLLLELQGGKVCVDC